MWNISFCALNQRVIFLHDFLVKPRTGYFIPLRQANFFSHVRNHCLLLLIRNIRINMDTWPLRPPRQVYPSSHVRNHCILLLHARHDRRQHNDSLLFINSWLHLSKTLPIPLYNFLYKVIITAQYIFSTFWVAVDLYFIFRQKQTALFRATKQ